MDTVIGYPSLLLKACGLLILLAMTQGCAVRIQSTHDPVHPESGGPVYLTATATGSVDKIEIWAEVSEITACLPNRIEQVVVRPYRRVAVCNPFGWRRSRTCWASIRGTDAPDNAIIRYRAVAKSPLWRTSTDEYSFAVGDFPCEQYPVPIRASTDDTSKSMDIVVVRDPDIEEEFFLSYLRDLIDDKFFRFDVFRKARHLHNYWYSRETGDYRRQNGVCVFEPPNAAGDSLFNLSDEAHVADVFLFLHATDQEDCASGVNFSSEFWLEHTIVHEAGHAIFDLRDEYSLADNPYAPPQTQGPPNLWDSKDKCEADSQALGLDSEGCRTRSTGGSHAIIDAAGVRGCVMGYQNPTSDFGPACRLRIHWKHRECEAGNCFPERESDTD